MGRNAALVLQPFGLGDCIFAQTLVRSLGYKRLIWPVIAQYLFDLKLAYPDIQWIPENMQDSPSDFHKVLNGIETIPIRWSDTIMGVPYQWVMKAKYDMYDLDYTKWTDQAMWRRSTPKEYQLLDDLNIRPGDEYNLVSMNYTSGFKMRGIQISNGLRTIYLNPIQGYSLFDWAAVMERAAEIHFVSSSSLYMLECLPIQAKRICIYQREVHEPHERYNYLFSKHKYIWV